VLPFARDVYDRPYLPGSSLKGALRTALAWGLLSAEERSPTAHELAPNPYHAAAPLERRLFGPSPNLDLLRALRVADLALVGDAEADVSVAAIYSLRGNHLASKGPGYRWHVESLPVGTRLAGSVSLDEHLLGLPAASRSFGSRRDWLADLPRHCVAFATELARREAAFYREWGPPAPLDFYRRLLDRAERAERAEGLIQLGWGTGWTAKTVGMVLQDDPRFPELVSRYRLDRGRVAPAFPKTRRLIERGNTPELPLGWVRFRLVPDGNDGVQVDGGG
jgi:CRISPR-associated protein Csm5